MKNLFLKIISLKTMRYFLIFIISLFIAINIILTYKTIEKYQLLADEAIEDGKRVIIVVPTEEVILKNKNEEADKIIKNKQNQKIDNSNINKNGLSVINKQQTSKSKIAILFVDIGKNERTTKAVMNIASQDKGNIKVGIAYSPYSPKVGALVQQGKELGHEAYVYAPMETSDYPLNDPGEMGIIKFAETENIKINMRHIIESADGYKGVIGTVGETITGSIKKTIDMLEVIKKYKILLIYNERPINSYLADEAKSRNIPIIKKFVVIDVIPTKDDIDSQLNKITEESFLENNNILVVARPSPLTITRIKLWIDDLKKKNITLSNVSELVH